MKLRAAFYLLLVFSFSFTLSLSSSAADEELNEIVFDDYGSYQEYLYFDFKPGDIVVYEPYVDALGNVYDNSYSSHALSEPRYPNFDINKINLDTIPQDIQNIIYSDNCGIFIRVWSNSYRVHVTRDCNFYYQFSYNSSGSITRSHENVGIATTNNGYSGYNPVCYYATYDFNGNLTSSWVKLSALDFSAPYQNTALSTAMKVFLYPFASDSDFYYCGTWSNMKGASGNSGISMSIGGSGSTSTITYANQFLSRPSTIADVYISSDLTFPTYESQELEVNKSIFQKLADIPDLIAEKVKSLFIPEEGYFDSISEELKAYFNDKLGLLIEIPTEVIGLIETLVSYQPETDEYKIVIPQINSGYIDSGGDFVEYTLIDEQEYVFDFLNEGAFATLYEFYRGFIWCVYVFMLINLIWRKANKVFGGGSE